MRLYQYNPPENIDSIFKFEFESIKMKGTNLKYTVYSYSREYMNMFLKQHGFSIENSYVQCIPIEKFDEETELILKPFKFKSNTSDEIFDIITTPQFIYDAIDMTCSELSESLLFGPAALRSDIEIFKMINDLINELPHVYVMENMLIDGDSGEVLNISHHDEIMNLYNAHGVCEMSDELYEAIDDTFIYESMHCSSVDEDVQPITIEGYVSYFTSMLVDTYA